MKHKQNYLVGASFFLVIFMMLGYLVKFFPETLAGIDSNIQTSVRGDLPANATVFFKIVTNFGHEVFIFVYVFAIAFVFYFWKKWKAEAILLAGNLVLMGIFSTGFKYLYNRPRPSIQYLIPKPMGPSFPSWHAAATMVVALSLVVIMEQHLTKTTLKRCLQVLVVVIALTTALSRIYLGVHYPSDILGGWLLAFAIAAATYPFYDQKRFEWRFQGKQE